MTTHLWVRAEQRPHERRVGLTPEGAAALVDAGIRVTIEDSPVRALPVEPYKQVGCEIAPAFSWPEAPADAIIFGLKELPEEETPLPHRHIMFGHAFKGQPSGQRLLRRFVEGGGTLYDLEYLTDERGRRVAAFGYWAGYAGAAVSLLCWAAQQQGQLAAAIGEFDSSQAMQTHVQHALDAANRSRPSAIVIGAKGRVGTGVSDLCAALGVSTTLWDMEETAHGGPFPEILAHDIFFNCILATPGVPVFVAANATKTARQLTVIGDIACDPDSAYSPVKVYDRSTSWDAPALRVHDAPPLDVMAIDNLPSLLPVESSQDYAAQLLPSLLTLDRINSGVWGRAQTVFKDKSRTLNARDL